MAVQTTDLMFADLMPGDQVVMHLGSQAPQRQAVVITMEHKSGRAARLRLEVDEAVRVEYRRQKRHIQP